MSRQTVSTKNVNTLINFAKSYADSTESMRGYKLTFSDIIENVNIINGKYYCDRCFDEQLSK